MALLARLTWFDGRWRRDQIPEFLVLAQMRQAREIPHAVQKDDAVEMIQLVLDDPRKESLRVHGDGFPFPIHRANSQRAPARDAAA